MVSYWSTICPWCLVCSIICTGVLMACHSISCPGVLSILSSVLESCLIYHLFWCSVYSISYLGVLLIYHLSWCPVSSIICPGVLLLLSSVLVCCLFCHLSWCPFYLISCSGVLCVLSVISPGVSKVHGVQSILSPVLVSHTSVISPAAPSVLCITVPGSLFWLF